MTLQTGIFSLDDAALWTTATVEQLRDVLLDGRIMMLREDDPAAIARADAALTLIQGHSRLAVAEGRMVDAGHLPNGVIQDNSPRAAKLINDGWIGHPFKDAYLLFHTWEEGPALLLVVPMLDAGNYACSIVELCPFLARGRRAVMVGDVVRVLTHEEGAGLIGPSPRELDPTKGGSFAIEVDVSFLKLMNAGTRAATREMADSSISNVVDPTWTILGMMATDGVEIETIPAPKHLNKQRVAKGKHPIPARIKVHSKPYITALLARAEHKPRADQGGTHASPVMHIRRGHPRVHPSGKRIWVRDCIVGAKDDVPGRSHYKLKAAAS